jgi:hypothetical protein
MVAPAGGFVEKTFRFAAASFRFRSLFVRLAFLKWLPPPGCPIFGEK